MIIGLLYLEPACLSPYFAAIDSKKRNFFAGVLLKKTGKDFIIASSNLLSKRSGLEVRALDINKYPIK